VPVVSPTVPKPKVDYATSNNFVFTEESSVRDSNWYIYLGLLAAIILGVGIVLAIQWYRAPALPLDPLPMNNEALENLRQELATAQQLIEALEQNVTKLTGSAEQNKKEISDLKSENRDLKDKIDLAEELENKNEELTNENTRLKNEIRELKTPEQDNRIIAEFEKLRELDVWEGLVLPPKDRNTAVLENSEFLWEYRDKVSLAHVSFVDLGLSVQGENSKINVSPYSEEHYTMVFRYADMVSLATRQVIMGKTIAEIKLTEEGLQFEWKDSRKSANVGPLDENVWIPIENRILLSKLRITIGEHSHDVALWTPHHLQIPHDPQDPMLFFFDDSSKLSLDVNIPLEDDIGTTAENFKKKLQEYGIGAEHTGTLFKQCGIQQAEIYLLLPGGKDRLLVMERAMP